MTKVTIKIEDKGLNKTLNGVYDFELPETWEECSKKQYAEIVAFLIDGDFSTGALRKFLCDVFGIPEKVLNHLVEREIFHLWQSMKFITTPPEHGTRKSSNWFFLEPIKEGMQNVTAYQFAMADQEMANFNTALKNGNAKKELRRFCAQLVTPFGKKYNPRTADLIEKFIWLAGHYRMMTWVYEYMGMRAWYRITFKRSFEGKDESGDFGWTGMFVDLAGEKFGTVDQVKKSSVFDIFTHVEKSLIAHAKRKK